MGEKVRFDFTLFVQRDADYRYTVRVVEIPDINSYGVILSKCIEEVRRVLIKVLSRAQPSELSHIKRLSSSALQTVEVEFHPMSKSGRRRKTKIRIKFSLIIIRHKEQFLVIVPKLDPPLKFYVDNIENLEKIAEDELKEYFHDYTTEAIMQYQYAVEEKLENLSIEVRVRSPLEVLEKKERDTIVEILGAGEDLVQMAKQDELPRAFEVDEYVQTLLDILAHPEHESILLVGPSQIGKTAVIYEVAHRLARKQCNESLYKRELWRFSVDSIAAFSIYWERALKTLVDYAREENLIIYFEDITRLIEGIGLVTHGAEMAKFLKEPIARGEIQIIGEITPEQYERFLTKDFGFLSLFKTIRLNPASDEKTYKILDSVRKALELKNDISIDRNAIDATIELTKRFRPYYSFPGKAVKLLKETINTFVTEKEKKKLLTKEKVFVEFSRQTGLPVVIISETPPLDLEQVERFFTQRIVGQQHAIDEIINLISKIKAGINDPDKPLGTFIFLGPTGVGKTFLAKCLAEYLFGSQDRMIRLDMSEYSGDDALLKLLGIPGSTKERGKLTQQIIEQPFSVILLDEIEKANYAVFDMLLQVLGEGRLTDAVGTTVDFRNAVVIMTSNLGASHREISSLGFLEKGKSIEEHFMGKLENFFKPEFINRIDHIVVFNPLTRDEIRKIAEKELEETISRYGFIRRRVNFEIDDQVIELIAAKGFSPVYGARPLKRAIEKYVITPIARYLATHRDAEIGLLKVIRDEDKVVVKSLYIKEPEVKISIQDPFVKRFGKIHLKELHLKIGEIRKRLEEINQSEKIEEIQRRMSNLLKEMKPKNFQKKSEVEKREINQQVYYLDLILNRVRTLVNEANFLEDLTDVVDREHDIAYLAELSQRFEQLQKDVAFCENEVAYAHLPDAGRGLLLLKRVGGKALLKGEVDWLKCIFNMYFSWIIQKGYSYSAYELIIPGKHDCIPLLKPMEFGKVGELKKYVQNLVNPVMFLFYVRGANVYGFLQGENGIHRFFGQLPEEKIFTAKYRMVKVECLRIPKENSIDDILKGIVEEARKRRREKWLSWLEAFGSESTGKEEIAREYKWSEGKGEVIDRKTGLRTKDIKRVLAGDLDPFILTYLRPQVLSLKEK